MKPHAAVATAAKRAATRRSRAMSHGPRNQYFIRSAAAVIAERSHLPELSLAFLTAFSVSAWDCWSKLTIRLYQKTRRLLSRADQLRSMRPARAAAPLSPDLSAAAAASGSSLSHAPLFASHTSAHACASEFRIV